MHMLTGKTFGRLLVGVKLPSRNGRAFWECLCVCGTVCAVTTNKLLCGNTKSCGCFAQEMRGKPRITHGETRGARKNWSPRSKMWYAAKSRARKSKLPFNIELTDIVIPETCPVFGFPLVCNRAGYARFDSPSLDRIKPELGYVVGNVQVISYKANTMKNDATVADVEQLLKFMQSK